MWMLLACAPSPAPRAADPVPAFTFAGCRELTRWVNADGDAVVYTALYLDEDRITAWDSEGVDESDWGASTWDGACETEAEIYKSSPAALDSFWVTTTCDEAGNPVREDSREEGLTVDGVLLTFSWAKTYANTYNDAGELVAFDQTYFDARGHGTVRWSVSLAWEGGHVVEEEWVDPSGEEDTRHISSIWEEDRLVERDTAQDSDPPWSSVERWTYDDLGRLTERGWSSTSDPDHLSGDRYTYADDTPRRATTESTEDGWATISGTSTSTWTCPD